MNTRLDPGEYPEWLTKWLSSQGMEPEEIYIKEEEGTETVTVILEKEYFRLFYYYESGRVDRETEET